MRCLDQNVCLYHHLLKQQRPMLGLHLLINDVSKILAVVDMGILEEYFLKFFDHSQLSALPIFFSLNIFFFNLDNLQNNRLKSEVQHLSMSIV